ncbi:MAG: 8-oxo-dGTP diphosphatase MutT [Gammaproteobacteria bacterium]|nr:8-oxo-dGTP diphosphatase MutT [Gammaproteobacteria bacterium]
MKPYIHVAAGIIFDDKGHVLIAERLPTQYKSGLWEFPGGKLELHESPFQALQRELREEIGIHVTTAQQWLQVAHEYEERVVVLEAWIIKQFSGEPHGAEGQIIRWVKPEQLVEYEFPDGNAILLERFGEIV